MELTIKKLIEDRKADQKQQEMLINERQKDRELDIKAKGEETKRKVAEKPTPPKKK